MPGPAPKLTSEGIQQIKEIVNAAVANPKQDIPGLSVSISNTKGEDLLTYAHGKVGCDSDKEITTDSMFWIASCTKMLTTVSVMQLVEKGLLKLDDADHLERIIPELKSLPIISLNEDGSLNLRKKKNQITLRHLLTHTAGFGYKFFNPEINTYLDFYNIDEFQLTHEAQFLTPLLFEPGTQFNYGLSIDVAGLALERVTNQKLGNYVKEHIYEPLGLTTSSFTPNAQLLEKLVHLHERDVKTGELKEREHILYATDLKNGFEYVHSGGAGSFSKPRNYVQFLATLMNDGVCPITGARILKKETIDEMFVNQIPEMPDFGRRKLTALDGLSYNITDLYPQEGNPPQGWGLSFFINLTPLPTGRSAGSGFWCGLSNVFYWFDRETGITGMVAAQILPFPDPKTFKAWADIETVVYQSLQN
ncbi:hypothetical protein WICPIJ_007005 [Wickerhamomyces pijperi]|uniref:Beta-lactamase-related domain-containing protein n=1 Tax=Wickerhamomyces pijperi TaxID=599730 RepID=A0A9P8Q0Z5_WICPI|nr:hypothetical protein WICPIJ_007005 [Wickerhamomyces pijperi]